MSRQLNYNVQIMTWSIILYVKQRVLLHDFNNGYETIIYEVATRQQLKYSL